VNTLERTQGWNNNFNAKYTGKELKRQPSPIKNVNNTTTQTFDTSGFEYNTGALKLVNRMSGQEGLELIQEHQSA